MSALSRRGFVAQTAALFSAARASFARDPLTARNLGVQLYTVRNVIDKDPAGVLKAIENIGYTEIEATFDKLDSILPALKQTRLKPVSVHVETAIFMEGGGRLDSALSHVKQQGFQYAVVPYIPPAQRRGADMFKRLAETLNKAGERAKANGLKLCYHNHAFEFEPQGESTGLELLLSGTQKNLVSLELDIFWASVAGHDPVQLLRTHAGRVALLHLKDKAPGIGVQFNENVPPTAFKEVGSGSIDIPAVLSAADAAGVKHYFVEQDHTPGDPIASLRQSYEYLRSKFKS